MMAKIKHSRLYVQIEFSTESVFFKSMASSVVMYMYELLNMAVHKLHITRHAT
jgi:hypothetical protein